jgi:proton-translocating NADH-quinone oxidoreductase chain M
VLTGLADDLICILLFIGAMGKSAQVPLHVWLPDSMEGPTPISALIHAATMVTAGIFMVARMSPLFELSDYGVVFVLVIGATTAFFMGLLGLVQNDIKRVVAYSTLSQLGYMTVALGASAYAAGIFHLMTHAFFKALLFLAAGSVIIAMHHEQDIRKMGGLRVHADHLLDGAAGLAGADRLPGLLRLLLQGRDHRGGAPTPSCPGAGYAYACVLIGVFVTALYSFRMFFLVFHGQERFDGFLTLAAGRDAPDIAWRLGLAFAGATFLASLWLWIGFERGTAEMQFQEFTSWIAAFNVNYHLGVDGISMPLILLTTLTTVLVAIAARDSVKDRLAYYLAAFLIMQGLMIGMFSALDAVLFYVFFEAMLIPMFIVIGVWGGPRRVYATIKFFLYTFLGSVFMLIALIYMYLQSGSFAILDFHHLPLPMTAQILIFLAFFAAFAVKIPMFPVHTWLPDAHVEAPTGGSVVLAAVMLKIGGYGFLRFSLPITPDAAAVLDVLVITLSLIAVVYIGLVALIQSDMKKLIAYSSIAHMGFVTLGFFIAFMIFRNTGDWTGASLGIAGGMVQMISHGFISAAMFLAVGRALRPAAQPQHRRLRRRGEHHALVRGVLRALCDGQHRSARHFRLRRGVHGHPRGLPRGFLAGLPGGHHAHSRRRLHAVAGEAGDLRRDRKRQRRRPAGSQSAASSW